MLLYGPLNGSPLPPSDALIPVFKDKVKLYIFCFHIYQTSPFLKTNSPAAAQHIFLVEQVAGKLVVLRIHKSKG